MACLLIFLDAFIINTLTFRDYISEVDALSVCCFCFYFHFFCLCYYFFCCVYFFASISSGLTEAVLLILYPLTALYAFSGVNDLNVCFWLYKCSFVDLTQVKNIGTAASHIVSDVDLSFHPWLKIPWTPVSISSLISWWASLHPTSPPKNPPCAYPLIIFLQ